MAVTNRSLYDRDFSMPGLTNRRPCCAPASWTRPTSRISPRRSKAKGAWRETRTRQPPRPSPEMATPAASSLRLMAGDDPPPAPRPRRSPRRQSQPESPAGRSRHPRLRHGGHRGGGRDRACRGDLPGGLSLGCGGHSRSGVPAVRVWGVGRLRNYLV